ncbi:single-stranded DNA-binding protein [Clostridium puniceum]|uniref:Single-stranded DNA-binding protein n=1 Tax=Clostridium puniceum TaxID=29367 RepID=A0A1S8TWC0_9CLOT|nr:single-stranded DNA-binding protein [Clostridium puniceum]OOM82036.1 single-stranded DNA-binding protein [Clostridium puniceum]
MNKVYLIGRVTRDLELQHYGTSKRSYIQFTLAVNEYNSATKQDSTNFINVVAFDRKAEILSQYITKGHKLSIQGKIRTGSYFDKNNEKKYTVDIILDDFNFIDNKPNVI